MALNVARETRRKYKTTTLAGTKNIYPSGSEGALDVAGLKSVAGKIGRGVKKVGEKAYEAGKQAKPYVRKGVQVGIETGEGLVKRGVFIGDVKLEEWKRKKLGEAPYGRQRVTPGYPQKYPSTQQSTEPYRGSQTVVPPYSRGERFGGAPQTVYSPVNAVCPRDRVAYAVGARVLQKSGILYCPICGEQLVIQG